MNPKDYVIANEIITEDIPYGAVGLVTEIIEGNAIVLFIGVGRTHSVSLHKIQFIDVTQTGKPHPQKICNICHVLKDNDQFDINQTDAQGRKTTRPSCTKCRVAIDGTGLLRDEARRLMAVAPRDIFKCPICGKTAIAGVTANYVKDHDHKTGKAREWICDSCNTGLGRFKDDVGLLQRAIDYLNKYA